MSRHIPIVDRQPSHSLLLLCFGGLLASGLHRPASTAEHEAEASRSWQVGAERPSGPSLMPAVSSGELCCATEGLDKYIPEFGNVLVQPAAGLVWKLHWLHRIGQEVHGRAARVPLVTFALSSKSEEGADAPVAAKRPILLKHLLCHCSGTSGKNY